MRRSLSSLLLGLLLPLAAAAQVRVQEYPLPPGHLAHDVWADPRPDGPVWISFQGSGDLGRLDPKTGRVELIDLGQDAAPHGVLIGPDGGVWLTDGGANAIVRVDPATRAIKRWPLPPERRRANLNTASFDGAGVLWFTGQNGIVGRLDPRSGAMKVFDAPRGAGPYGIQTTPDGTVYFASLAGSYLGRIERDDRITVLEPPTPRQGARRVWSDSKGQVWVAEWNSGQLTRFDPNTGTWKSWKAPGRDPQLYAVYVDENDKVWCSEWTAQLMLRFDPVTQKFDSFKSSSSRPNVRQIHGRAGEVWTPESGADKIVVYRTR